MQNVGSPADLILYASQVLNTITEVKSNVSEAL